MSRLEAVEQVISCTNCELHQVGSGPIPFSGPKENANGIAIIGEAPGKQEDKVGEPFIGPAGELLRKHLTEVGITPERCFIINTVSCWPDATPKLEHVKACAHNKAAQLAVANPRWILILGKVAMDAARSGLKISSARGRIFVKNGIIHMITYHPAAALRKGTYEKQMRADLEFFLEVCKAGAEWKQYLSETCWECGSDEVAWFDRDLVQWCEKHAPRAFHDRMAYLKDDYDAACKRLAEAEAVGRRNAAIAQVEENADPEWLEKAYEALKVYLTNHETMFVDDFWQETGLEKPREARALGAVFNRASRNKLMARTDQTKNSVASNMTPKPIWRSLIYVP